MLEFFETLSMCLGGFIGSLGLDLCFLSLAAGIGFTVMYHPDGSPLLYSEWIEMMEEDYDGC